MGIEKVRRGFYIKGPLTIGGNATAGGNVTATGGTVTLGADVALIRKAANRAGLATGDVLDQSGTPHSLRVPDADAYPTLANDGEIVVVSALPGTARIYWRALGTTYHADAS